MKKKPEEKRKKARKFVSCNHQMHLTCFNTFILFNHYEDEFACPLCKKLSNIILFDFSYISKLIKGIKYNDDKINWNDFYKTKEDDINNELLLFNITSFENYCSKLLKKQILIKDFNEDTSLLKKVIQLILDDFEEFTMYYSRTNNKQEQIEIWKNILYNIRLLFQYKILNIPDNISKLIENIIKINNIAIFEELLMKYDFINIIDMFIMFSFLLFDSNEENKEKIKYIFQNDILFYFINITFLKHNKNDDIDLFLTNNQKELKKALDLFCLKYKICLLLFDEKEEKININLPIEQIIAFMKSNFNIINLIISDKKEKYISHIKKQYLEIPEFNIINLPDSGFEFLNISNGNCIYCHKKNLSSYLCLFCGNKICNSIYCILENELTKKKEYSLIYHSKKCCGGNGLFLKISNSEIMFILKRKIIESKIFIYLNDFGDVLKNTTYMNDEYKLNKDELQKGIMNFINMTFRKKSHKIKFRNNN